MDNKVKLEFEIPAEKTVVYGKSSFTIIPFLSLAQQAFLINQYLQEYFNKSDDAVIVDSDCDFIGAGSNMFNYILQMLTNIDTDSLSNDVYADSEFKSFIVKQIVNFEDFENKLDAIVEEVKEKREIENSAGKVVERLIEKLSGVLENINSITPEQIESAKNTGLELMKKLETTTVLDEAQKLKKPGETIETAMVRATEEAKKLAGVTPVKAKRGRKPKSA